MDEKSLEQQEPAPAGGSRAFTPIFWLFLGPPVFRAADRAATDSLSLAFDAWNALQALWWLVFGVLAVRDLYRERAALRPLLASLGVFPWLVGAWLLTLFVSSAVSPSPIFSFGNAGLMTILVLAALDLALKIRLGRLDGGEVVRRLFLFSLALVAVFWTAFLLDPEIVGADGFGSRARGDRVTDIALVGQIVAFSGLFVAYRARWPSNAVWTALAAAAPLLLLVARTRAMYVAFIAAAAVFSVGWLRAVGRRARLQSVTALLLGLCGLLGVLAYEDFAGRRMLGTAVEELIVRDPDTLQGWNGRDGLALVLLDRLAERPWGLGYSAGPREVLMTAPMEELRRVGIYERFAGNAHNMYMEVLGGSGVLGGVVFLAMLAWVWMRSMRVRTLAAVPVRALYVSVLVGGLTESYGVLPFYQSSALLWIAAAFLASVAVPAVPAAPRRAAELNASPAPRQAVPAIVRRPPDRSPPGAGG